jgi:hypothetical protein
MRSGEGGEQHGEEAHRQVLAGEAGPVLQVGLLEQSHVDDAHHAALGVADGIVGGEVPVVHHEGTVGEPLAPFQDLLVDLARHARPQRVGAGVEHHVAAIRDVVRRG